MWSHSHDSRAIAQIGSATGSASCH